MNKKQHTHTLKSLISEIKQNEERFRLMVEGSEQVFFYTHNNNHIFQYLSSSVQTVLGYAPEELIGKPYELTLTDDPSNAMVMELTDQALLTGDRSAPYIAVMKHKDGRSLFAEIVETPIKIGGRVVGMKGFARDITERKLAEIELRNSEKRERLLAEIALKIRESLDLNQIFATTVIEVRNFLQADRVYIGYCGGNLPPQVIAESVKSEFPKLLNFIPDDNLLAEIKTIFKQEAAQAVDDFSKVQLTPHRARAIAAIQAKASLSVPLMVKGEFFGVLVANQCSAPRHWQQFEIDLLEELATQVVIAIQQAQLFQQVQALNANLERKVEERTVQLLQKMEELQNLYQHQDEFLHAVSHDLRTPIMGTLMLLKNWQQSSAKTISIPRKILDRMIESSDRQLNLINSLLETHATEVSGIALQRKSVQLRTLIQSIAEDLEPLLTKNQAKLNNLVLSDLPLIDADSLQLRRVLENLLSNAINHNPPGLQLTIQASIEEDMICCLVQDNGIGMTEAQSEQLFERYARGDRSRSTGIGLGLYLCRQIITAHGGQIGVKSSLDAGATVWFTLPLVTTST
ncbi:MAG TPA: ATP-binding protein [Oculatellaceae cyanobacterium]|jgi:PAS domain S-box-containing protein